MFNWLQTLQEPTNIKNILVTIAIVVAAFLLSLFSRIVTLLIQHLVTKRTRTELDDQIIALIAKPVRRLILVIGFYLAIHHLDELVTDMIFKIIDGILYVWVVVIFTLMIIDLFSLLINWYGQKLAATSDAKGRAEFFPLIDRVIKIVTFAIAVIFVLKHFNQDVGSLIVSLGVGSLAIALAAQSTLANMIAGFTIMVDRPFRVGDRVQLSTGEKGDVYEIGIRSTKILTFENTMLIIPNDTIVKDRLINLSYPNPTIRVKVDVGVAYGSDTDQVKKILLAVAHNHPLVLKEPTPQAYFIEFGDSALQFTLIGRTDQFANQWQVQEELRNSIYRAFQEQGIDIPFPQQVVHVRQN